LISRSALDFFRKAVWGKGGRYRILAEYEKLDARGDGEWALVTVIKASLE
jgi:hypothetical protein